MSTTSSNTPPSPDMPDSQGHDEHASRKPRPAIYHSYLLRLWRDQALDGWHASLQSTKTGERHSFADLHSLLAFLLSQAQTPDA